MAMGLRTRPGVHATGRQMGHYRWPCAIGGASIRSSTRMFCPTDIGAALTPGRGLVLLSVPKATGPSNMYQLWLFIVGMGHVVVGRRVPVFICQ